MHPLYRRLTSSGPKRVLALDGGGVRGMLSLGMLARIETLLRTRHDNPDLCLADYFDLIGGTSTGAIIASALALGRDVQWIRDKYFELGESIFSGKTWFFGGWVQERYRAAALKRHLKKIFGDTTLGHETLLTGLCIVTKRSDSNSTWPLINHPDGRFFEANKDYLLRSIIRASTAAPTYFKSERIDIRGEGNTRFNREFIDGGISMHNNPAWLLFQIATLRGFPFHWPTGEENLLLVSVGTGYFGIRGDRRPSLFRHGAGWGKRLVEMLMEDATWQNQQILQQLSNTPTPVNIDLEVGDLSQDLLPGGPHLSYLRYDVPLTNAKLAALNLPKLPFDVEGIQEMDAPKNLPQLDELGQLAAPELVHALHFPRAFDLNPEDP